jgi:tetratricopeptide (TPR) repeat protein
MATHPEDPRKPDSPRDPKAESAGKPDHVETPDPVIQGPGGTIDDSDSAIELGLPAGSADILSDSDLHPPVASESGVTSGIAWAALMEELPEPADEVQIDSPSDADLLAEPPAGKVPPETTLIGPPAELSSFPPRSGLSMPETPAPTESQAAAEPFEPRDIFTAEPTGRYPRPDTGTGTSGESAVVTPPPPSDSARVDLGAPPRPAPSSGIESSIIDLGAVDFPGDPPPSSAVEEAELASETSGIDLAAEPSGGTGSGRDLIAEALESGIKFGAPPEPSDSGAAALPSESAINFGLAPKPETTQKPATPKPAASPFSSAIEFGGPGKPAESSPFSSAIDFGGTASPPPAIPTPPPQPRPPTASAISSAVDYSGSPHHPQDSSSSVQLAPDMPDDLEPFEVRPPTVNPASGRPPTETATDEEMAAQILASGENLTPNDSEVDLGSHPSTGDFEPFEGPPGVAVPASSRPVKTDSDSDIDINIGELPEESSAVGSGLFVNANSGRLEPTDAAIDLDAAAVPEDVTETDAPALAEEEIVEKAAPIPGDPVKARGSRRAWLGGTAIGAVLGSAAVALLQILGFGFGGSSSPSQPSPVAQGAPPVTAPAPPPAAAAPAGPAVSKFDLLQNGDFDKAAQAGIEQIDENNPEQLGHRGEFRWLAYLQKQHATKAALNPADAGVKQAAADLQAAADKGNTDALFWLGHLQESTNAVDKAKASYAKGAGEAKDPLQKRRFEAALNRLELREPAKAAGAARGPDAAEALLLAMVALQAPAAAPAPAAAADADEAGFAFWEAARLARDQKYAEAVQALDKARALHDQRRYSRLRKAQNPLSDPTEEVFLRSADELKAYWQLQEKLRAGGYVDVASRDPGKAVDALIAQAKEGSEAKARADKLAKDSEKAAADLAKLGTDLKAAKDQAAAQTAKLKTAEEQLTAEAAKLKTAEESASAKLKAAEGREQALTAEKNSAEGDLAKITDELAKAKLVDPKAGRKGLLDGVQSAVRAATTNDSQGLMRTLQVEANRYREQLGQRWKPNEMLTYWLPLLRDRTRSEIAARAVVDAARVAEDPESTAAEKARAEAVLGLALRNQGKFSEAKVALEKAKAGLVPADAEWRERVDAALKDVADPAAYYLARAEELQNQGKTADAIVALEQAEKAYPAGAARFRAQRGLFQLEVARSKSPDRLAPNDPALQAARKDADEAAKSGDAYALYAAGRLAEESADYEAAVTDYRKAVAAHPAHDAAGSRYRLALARALLRASAAANPADAPRSEAPQPADKAGVPAVRSAPPKDAVLMLLTVLLQGAPPAANQSEATQLADEILASPDSTLEMRAQALAIKGMYTQALLTYADALRPALTREQVDTLKELILTHPALRRPETQAIASPPEAERHYATGLRLLYSGQYAAAEKDLLAAVGQDGQDARYYYFLGLARLYQGKRDAFEDFVQGARLEQQGLPPREAIDSALERVQGPARGTIDNARGVPR